MRPQLAREDPFASAYERTSVQSTPSPSPWRSRNARRRTLPLRPIAPHTSMRHRRSGPCAAASRAESREAAGSHADPGSSRSTICKAAAARATFPKLRSRVRARFPARFQVSQSQRCGRGTQFSDTVREGELTKVAVAGRGTFRVLVGCKFAWHHQGVDTVRQSAAAEWHCTALSADLASAHRLIEPATGPAGFAVAASASCWRARVLASTRVWVRSRRGWRR